MTGSNGCSKTDSVNVFVNIVPDVNPAPDQTVCNGQMTQAIPHTGTWPGTTFDVLNNTPSIGLGAMATNVKHCALHRHGNNGTAPVVATVTVTALKSTANGLTYWETRYVHHHRQPFGETRYRGKTDGLFGRKHRAECKRREQYPPCGAQAQAPLRSR